jgi:hypothetical protein
MATWKKVIVSGSNISQLANDAGYLTAVTATNAFATMSINGVNLIADSSTDAVTIASSSGAGLNITGDAGSDTITFTLGAIPNSSLANSTISGKALGTNLDSLTAGAGLTGTTYNGSAASTFAVGAGTHITVNADDVAVNTTTLTPVIWAASGSYTGSIFSGITGDVTISAAGVSAIGSGVIVNADVNASAGIVYTKLNFANSGFVSASAFSSPSQGTVRATINGVNTDVDTGLQTGDSPQFVNLTLTGDAAVNGGDITTTAATATIFNANATTINLGSAATSLNLGAGSGNTTVNNNLVVTGDLTVNGTTTTVNTTNVLVEDKFILLASGSTAGTDGGIIVQSAVAGTGFAFGYDTADDRWVFQDALAGTATSFGTITAYATTTQYGTAASKPNDATGPAYGGASTGYGNMWVSTDTGDIWIYS